MSKLVHLNDSNDSIWIRIAVLPHIKYCYTQEMKWKFRNFESLKHQASDRKNPNLSSLVRVIGRQCHEFIWNDIFSNSPFDVCVSRSVLKCVGWHFSHIERWVECLDMHNFCVLIKYWEKNYENSILWVNLRVLIVLICFRWIALVLLLLLSFTELFTSVFVYLFSICGVKPPWLSPSTCYKL